MLVSILFDFFLQQFEKKITNIFRPKIKKKATKLKINKKKEFAKIHIINVIFGIEKKRLNKAKSIRVKVQSREKCM